MSRARQDGITLRQWLPLVGLTCCAFVFNTSEFMPIGLLTDIAASFSLTEAQAGIMISVYAWGVMLLSLPLMVFASRFEFKRMLLGVLAVCALLWLRVGGRPDVKRLGPYLLCALLPIAWYMALLNHSAEHAFFTYRALCVTIFAAVSMAIPTGKAET